VQNYIGVTSDTVKIFFTDAPGIPRDILTARNLAKDMLMCDFESVMLCSRHNRRIFVSLVISYIFYLVISTLMGFVGLKGVANITFYLIPFITLWLAYGLSPMCLPMIPTCILSDIIESVQIIMPAKITWPDTLQIYPGCLGPKWYDPNATVIPPPQFANITRGSSACMLSCRGPPFYFLSWESSLAWITCTFNSTTCVSLEIPYSSNFTQHARDYSQVLVSGYNTTDFRAVDTNAAYTFCFWMTIAQAVPFILLALAVVLLAITMLQLPFMITTAVVQCFVQAFVYTHVAE
jgi:hypothetical protein